MEHIGRIARQKLGFDDGSVILLRLSIWK